MTGHALKHKLHWLRAIGRWLAELSHLWLALLVVAIALVVSLRPGTPEPTIRLSGLALQILGIATVAWGIAETRALFGHPPVFQVARNWLRRFPHFGTRTVTASINSALSGAVASARGYAMHGPAENPTIDSRVDALEKNVLRINERIDQTQREMEAEFRKTTAALKQEEQTRASEDHAIREKLEATGTGGVHISAIGAIWLFVGVTLSTASPEIARWLQ